MNKQSLGRGAQRYHKQPGRGRGQAGAGPAAQPAELAPRSQGPSHAELIAQARKMNEPISINGEPGGNCLMCLVLLFVLVLCAEQFVPEYFLCTPFATVLSLNPSSARKVYKTYCLQVGFHPLWGQAGRLMTMKDKTAAMEKQKRGLHCPQRQNFWKEPGSKRTDPGHMPKTRRR